MGGLLGGRVVSGCVFLRGCVCVGVSDLLT